MKCIALLSLLFAPVLQAQSLPSAVTNLTDVWHVIEGSATLVTGGSVVDGASTTPGEILGQSINGGSSRKMRKGEFAIIPAGVAHWVSSVDGKEFLYIVVKMPRQR